MSKGLVAKTIYVQQLPLQAQRHATPTTKLYLLGYTMRGVPGTLIGSNRSLRGQCTLASADSPASVRADLACKFLFLLS